jgi:hypothetical protein
VLLLLASPVSAQTVGRLSIVGTIEYARITEDDGFLGAGAGVAGGVQLQLTDRTSLAVEVGTERHGRDLDLFAVAFDGQGRPVPLPLKVRWEGTAVFVVGSVAYAFGTARVRPVVSGGIGMMFHGGTERGPVAPPQVPPGHTLQPEDVETRRGRDVNALTLEGSFGADMRLTRRVVLRPFVGLRLANTGNVGPKYIIRAGGRIAVGW